MNELIYILNHRLLDNLQRHKSTHSKSYEITYEYSVMIANNYNINSDNMSCI